MKSCLATMALCLCIVLASRYYLHQLDRQNTGAAMQTRESLVEQQVAQQTLARLEQEKTHPLLGVLGEDLSALQIRIAEWLSEQREHDKAVVVAYKQSPLSQAMDDAVDDSHGSITSIRALRLDVHVQVDHSLAFLSWLKSFSVALQGWPMDVRACEINKSTHSALDIRCIVDIYHWLISSKLTSASLRDKS